ncbi:hypothetical protein ASPZODRAFT_72091 [Penicilliopsis zonata CBS 506.65]|uniref:Major facilitator superfamily (MFS) profile domain-containing protein n=1 Tax=Penicilliopsis zonata CBS 506.65 TaxID=1073090 RepID=A0A1L9SAY8_9EURO|nr:hypothetical protein ASPZODRAFT_72091 [Penicilliopsis zonata CBS 506.65]OJJ44279.1 hypothetical protein ASPZODRAFT_72091 [Penicilliopsis zonata CBS 506.65]
MNDSEIPDPKHDPEHVEEAVLARLTDDDLWRMSQEALTLNSWTGVRLMLVMFVQCCNMAGYGVDWGIISGIDDFSTWHDYFGFPSSGGTYGTLNALMSVGTIAGAPFMAFADVIGRRGINFVGNFLVLAAAILQGCSRTVPQFMAGRFMLGFGTALMSSSQYMGEIAPLHLRGRMVGWFGAFYQVGALATLGAMIGLANLSNNWSWRAPLLLEGLFPLIVCSTIYFLTPESPRFLILRGKKEKARQVVARYSTTSGDVNEPIVDVVIRQIEESLESDRTSFRSFWDYRVFFTKAVRYRLLVLALYSVFQQWNGGSIITYYMSPALDTIGITATKPQLGVTIGTTAVYFVFTVVGSHLVDIFRRRTLIFAGLSTMILFEFAATITSWQYSLSGNKASADLTLLWIYLYQACSATFVATMHNLYPIEVLSLPLRAKGMGLYSLIQGAAGAVQTYGISVGIQKIGYKIWVVYVVYNTIQLILAYFIFPETSKLSLEEIDAVFETPGIAPVKMSLDIKKAKKELERSAREGERV